MTKNELKIINNAIDDGIEYIKDDSNDVSQGIKGHYYPLANDDAQSFWDISSDELRKTKKGNHRLKKMNSFEYWTFIYANGVYESFTGRTMRMKLNFRRDANNIITKCKFFWADCTNI